MRARINLLTLGVTALVVIAFVVPLGLLVQRQADQRGRLQAERVAQTLAAVVVRAVSSSEEAVTATKLQEELGPLPPMSAVVLPDGVTLGNPVDRGLVADVVESGRALSMYTPDGFVLAIPVITAGGTIVVVAAVAESELSRGVPAAWGLLAILGFGTILAALLVADRLGRTVVGPSRELAAAADRLGHGDLSTRVAGSGPPELMAIATAFNVLADRIAGLLAAEREQVADLSHRLRTPLTALRLQAEQLDSDADRSIMLDKVDRLSAEIDHIIREARDRPESTVAAADLAEVVRRRVDFWRVLAEEQGREMTTTVLDRPVMVPVDEREAAAALDAMIGNVFSHTAPGIAFSVTLMDEDESISLVVSDHGPGFPTGFDPRRRGASGSGSSGLGLDIVSRFAETAGGELRLDSNRTQGARVKVILPATGRSIRPSSSPPGADN